MAPLVTLGEPIQVVPFQIFTPKKKAKSNERRTKNKDKKQREQKQKAKSSKAKGKRQKSKKQKAKGRKQKAKKQRLVVIRKKKSMKSRRTERKRSCRSGRTQRLDERGAHEEAAETSPRKEEMSTVSMMQRWKAWFRA
mgnify:CR=1 FL=1